ncbi:MAG: STAS domain-containing protein [Leptospiraceae bacterium]|nr:STAS domain-containing protein [Leptospiraceae bacterium]
MQIKVDERLEHKVIGLRGVLVLDNIEGVRTEIYRLLDADEKDIVLDFDGLRVLDSSGIGLLIQIQRRLVAANRSIQLINLNNHVREVFRVSGLDKVFELSDEVD